MSDSRKVEDQTREALQRLLTANGKIEPVPAHIPDDHLYHPGPGPTAADYRFAHRVFATPVGVDAMREALEEARLVLESWHGVLLRREAFIVPEPNFNELQVVKTIEAALASAPQSVPAGTLPFPTYGDAITDARLHERANAMLQAKKHSMQAANDFKLSADCQAVIRDLLIEALAIGANEYAAPAGTRDDGIEAAIDIVRTEEECPGEPPAYVVDAMEKAGPVMNARAAVRATKKSLIERLRALKSQPAPAGRDEEKKWFTDSDAKIERDELRRLFGDEMPLEAGQLLFGAEPGLTLRELREKLASIAALKSTPSLQGGDEFPYTRTFNAIMAAVTWKPHGQIGISVNKFQEAYNRANAPAVSGDGWSAANEYKKALQTIVNGIPTPEAANVYRTDGKRSKHDECKHGRFMYEDCGQCVEEFASAELDRIRRHFPSPEGRGDA